MFTITDINKYGSEKLTDEQKNEVIDHCNKFEISPNICAWYEDMKDFYVDWVYDHEIYETERQAKERYLEGLETGEFCQLTRGSIVRFGGDV